MPPLLKLGVDVQTEEPSVLSAGYSLMLGCRRGWLMDGGGGQAGGRPRS